MGHQKGTKTK